MDRHKINTIAVYGSHATMRLTDDVTALLTALAEHGVDLYIEAPLWDCLLYTSLIAHLLVLVS